MKNQPSMPVELTRPDEVIRILKPGQRIFVQGAAATPAQLLSTLAEQSKSLPNTEIMHLHTHGPAAYVDCPEFKITNLFVGENLRKKLDYDRVDYLPCFLSEIPLLFRRGIRAPDVAIVQVSPPDKHGYCSLGTSVDITQAAVETAKTVIAQVNRFVPRTHGDSWLHLNQIDFVWYNDTPLLASAAKSPGAIETAIANHVASLIDDGACLQMGIGGIPDAVLMALKGHKHLGIHTEMFSDGLVDLLANGAVDNSRKAVHAGQTVTSFVNGSDKLFKFVDDNPSVIFLGSDYVNRTTNIARNSNVVAINSAVEIDLTGQVVADSIGHGVISGVGGQMDFIRGATLSPGGKAVIALPSRTKSGKSRIVSQLALGAGVVTTRAHVHFVVTEFGVADLFGKTLGERAHSLIAIAHPEDRESLSRDWKMSHSVATSRH